VSGKVTLLSGERRAGKTTVCLRAVALAQSDGFTCAGLLTVNRGDDVLDVVDIRSGDARRLTLGGSAPAAVHQGKFLFDARTLSWANTALLAATPCDLLVIDELGPLEFHKGEGWPAAFEVVRRNDYGLAVVVVRPELLAESQERMASTTATVLRTAANNREQLPQEILRMLRCRVGAEGE
jgi:nucleoside-triphosphatase THEP1